MRQRDLIKIEEATKKFFRNIGGSLLCSTYAKIQTYSSHNSKIPCINYYIIFDNKNLFGKGNFSEEVYPRYRRMRTDWKNALKKDGIKLYPDIAVGFIPLLNSENAKNIKKFKYRKEQGKPLGARILNINKINLDYYREMAKRFSVNFALKEKNGMFVGPERGMMYVLEVALNILKKTDCFVDIGAGTGEMSAYVLKNCNPKKVMVNELSQNLKMHLKNYLKKIASDNKTKIIFNFHDCQKIKFPSEINLISVGVFYGAQPSFVKRKGSEMAKSLGKNGLLLIQSSMPETLFSQHILMGDNNDINRWPWYSKKFILSNHFSCVEAFFIDNQFITLASQSHSLIKKIVMKLEGKVIPYDSFVLSRNKL